MKIGCCLTIEHLDKLPPCGYDYIELPGRDLAELSASQAVALQSKLQSLNLDCKGLNAYCYQNIIIAGPNQDLSAVKKHARTLAEYGSEIGVKKVGIGSPKSRMLPSGYKKEIADAQLIDFLKCTADEFAPYGIDVALEPLRLCYCNYINTLDEALQIVKSVNHPNVKIVLDYYNMEHVGEADIDVLPYLPYVAHAHISDDAGTPQERYFLKKEKFETHRTRLINLYNNGYNDTLSVEVDLPPNDTDCVQTYNFLRELFPK